MVSFCLCIYYIMYTYILYTAITLCIPKEIWKTFETYCLKYVIYGAIASHRIDPIMGSKQQISIFYSMLRNLEATAVTFLFHTYFLLQEKSKNKIQFL